MSYSLKKEFIQLLLFLMAIELQKDLTAEAATSVTFSKDFREMKWVWPQNAGGPSHYKYVDSKLAP